MQGLGSLSRERLPGGTGPRALAAALLCLAVSPAGAGAASIPVTTFADESSNNPTCSLREAIKAANDNSMAHEDACTAGEANPLVDSISLLAGTYTLAGASEDANVSGDLDLIAAGPVVVDGSSAAGDVPTTTIDVNNADRLFDLQPDGGGIVNLTAQEVILRDGNVGAGQDGGAIRVRDPDARIEVSGSRILDSGAGHYGGAIHFDGGNATSIFRIVQSEIAGNTAGSEGGGIWLDADYDAIDEVKNSLIAGNSADMGGGIYLGTRVMNGVQLDMTNSTVTGNSASQAGGALAFDLSESGNAFFFFSTIADNTSAAAGSGGGIHTVSTPPMEQFVYFGQSIIANNKAAGAPSNCFGPGNFQSAGFNIESTNSCGLSAGNDDLVNTDPMLAPLAAYPGGELTTRTRGLYDGSPALDRIPRTPVDRCLSAGGVDQRGIPRPARRRPDCATSAPSRVRSGRRRRRRPSARARPRPRSVPTARTSSSAPRRPM